jgi:hypothetical protein
MKGRKIEDLVKLAKFLLNYAEAAEEDELIVALDQEKAYDRINHAYLLRVLQHMGFPPKFYNTIKALYTNTETVVMINREISESFIVIRGVRQGDPLSCLLFNLAIEPLAYLLRDSELKGVKVPGKDEELIVSPFADDTTIYLSSSNVLEKLWEILRLWCAASTASEHKTVLLPFGRPIYRAKVLQERRLNDRKQIGAIEETMRVILDGQTCRVSGAWIVVEKINSDLERWKLTSPGLEGNGT